MHDVNTMIVPTLHNGEYMGAQRSRDKNWNVEFAFIRLGNNSYKLNMDIKREAVIGNGPSIL